MYIPNQNILQLPLWNGIFGSLTQPIGGWADTGTELRREWANPSVVVATVLILMGGNVIHEALAQTTGEWFTPVCFSFGWASYALASLKNVFAEGRLLLPPDYLVKVYNVTSGYSRMNKNWLLGRIVRDHDISEFKPLGQNGIRIAVFEALPVTKNRERDLYYNSRLYLGVAVMLIQLLIAAIPTLRTQGHEWGILAVTGLGTLLSIMMGILPQWAVEKFPTRRDSKKVFALTAGAGSRNVMIIKGEGHCLDIEEMAAAESPRTARPWMKVEKNSPSGSRTGRWESKMVFGLPLGLHITRVVCTLGAFGWLLILISLAGIRSHTWCLIAVGAIGMAHNSMLADLRREPKTRNLPLKQIDTISTMKIMDGLMDLEVSHEGCGEALLRDFFPGRLLEDEEEWWNTVNRRRSETAYDRKRAKDSARRLCPRSMLPRI